MPLPIGGFLPELAFIAGFAGIDAFNAGQCASTVSPGNRVRVHLRKSVSIRVAFGRLRLEKRCFQKGNFFGSSQRPDAV
jgi:hypothetical protein